MYKRVHARTVARPYLPSLRRPPFPIPRLARPGSQLTSMCVPRAAKNQNGAEYFSINRHFWAEYIRPGRSGYFMASLPRRPTRDTVCGFTGSQNVPPFQRKYWVSGSIVGIVKPHVYIVLCSYLYFIVASTVQPSIIFYKH